MEKTVTIFGSSLPKEGEKEYTDAYNLAKKFSLAGFNICNGGNLGIMEATAKAAYENNTKAIGVVADVFLTLPNKYLSEVIHCNTLFERIEKLISLGDAYVVLQGGTGTLLELAAVWEFINKGLMQKKPIACHSSLWRKIIPFMEEQIQKEKRQTGLVKTFTDTDECADYIISSLNSKTI